MKKTELKRKTPLRAKRSKLSSKVPSKKKVIRIKRGDINVSKTIVARKKGKPKSGQTPAKLKKKLDQVFSWYIRAKYPKVCYTCGRTGTLQNGHFVSRQYLATRWDESNCRPQCVGCNIYGHGKPLDFEERLKKELGDNVVEAMKKKRHTVLKLSRQWYTEQIAHYENLLKQYD